MTKFLKLVHNWTGFFISLIMLIVLTTGVYLGSVDLIKRMDDKGQTYLSLTHQQKAEITADVLARYPETTSVTLPTEAIPYVEASAKLKSVFLTTELTEIDTQIKTENKVWRWLFFFHRNFQLGDIGKHANAISAILATAIMFIGLYLWWLIRKGFKWRHTLPKNTKNSALIKSHIQLGLIFSLPLLVMAITGAYITYGSWGPSTIDSNKSLAIIAPANNWQAQLQSAQQLWPEANMVSISKPRKPELNNYIYTVSFNADNALGLQKTDTIKIDLYSGQLQSAQTFKEKGLAYQLKYSARFLHDGARMSSWYLIILIVSSILTSAMVCFVIISFVRKRI
ncbi:PepSY-associated TM helix domain-containing protein [Colwelliaceae bacterium BS250]